MSRFKSTTTWPDHTPSFAPFELDAELDEVSGGLGLPGGLPNLSPELLQEVQHLYPELQEWMARLPQYFPQHEELPPPEEQPPPHEQPPSPVDPYLFGPGGPGGPISY